MRSWSPSLDRALAGSPLRTPQGGSIFAGIMLLLLLLSVYGHGALWANNSAEALGVALRAMLLASLAVLPALALIWYLDRHERESFWLLIGALLWGMVISTGVSALFNQLFGMAALTWLGQLGALSSRTGQIIGGWLPVAVVAPLVEELAKGLGVLLLFWFMRAEFDNVRDGIIYGALVGLGFIIAEFGLYMMKSYVARGATPYMELLALRLPFLGLNSHLVWTALVGAGIGLARQTPRRWLRVVAPVGAFALAVVSHGVHNSAGIAMLGGLFAFFGYNPAAGVSAVLAVWGSATVLQVLLQAVPYAILAYLIIQGARWEWAVIRRYLTDEVGTPTITLIEYLLLERGGPFRSLRLPRKPDRTVQALVNAQNELAFRKWHLDRRGVAADNDALVRAWRADIARLRGSEKT